MQPNINIITVMLQHIINYFLSSNHSQYFRNVFKEVNKEVLRHTTLPTQIVDTYAICLFSFVHDSKKETSSDGPKMVK